MSPNVTYIDRAVYGCLKSDEFHPDVMQHIVKFLKYVQKCILRKGFERLKFVRVNVNA